MKPSSILNLLPLYLTITPSNAFPRFKGLNEFLITARQAPSTPPELLGDLLNLTDAKLSPTAKTIKAILLGREPGDDTKTYYTDSPPDKGTSACKADPCCIWKHVADEMLSKFRGSSGRCTKLARSAIRLGFHDAGTFSKVRPGSGGADGSIILSGEISRPDHAGLQEIHGVVKGWYDKYKQHGVGAADLVQMAANVGALACPLGPRVRTFVGRKDSSKPSPEGTLPDVTDPPQKLVWLFEDKTISPLGLVALLGAHSTSQQRIVDKERGGDPQDTTPGVWDVSFYGQTKAGGGPPGGAPPGGPPTGPPSGPPSGTPSGRPTGPPAGPPTGSPSSYGTSGAASGGGVAAPPKGVFKFQSDLALANYPDTRGHWDSFSAPNAQAPWNAAYAKEYVRVSMLGVSNINELTECTKVLPKPISAFTSADQSLVEKWLEGKYEKKLSPGIAKTLEDGGLIFSLVGQGLGSRRWLRGVLDRIVAR